jgi:hypothetical protein
MGSPPLQKVFGVSLIYFKGRRGGDMVHISDSKRQLSRDSPIRLGHFGQAEKLENQEK